MLALQGSSPSQGTLHPRLDAPKTKPSWPWEVPARKDAVRVLGFSMWSLSLSVNLGSHIRVVSSSLKGEAFVPDWNSVASQREPAEVTQSNNNNKVQVLIFFPLRL